MHVDKLKYINIRIFDWSKLIQIGHHIEIEMFITKWTLVSHVIVQMQGKGCSDITGITLNVL